MPASQVLGAMLSLVKPGLDLTPARVEGSVAEATIWSAGADELNLALQQGLREAVRVWVNGSEPRALRHHLRANDALLTELLRRQSVDAKADNRMATTTGTRAAGDWDSALARARVCVRRLAQDVARWSSASPRVARRDAENLGWQLQDVAGELLDLAGRFDARDDRQANWLELISNPHVIGLERDDHACALIGASCWHEAGSGRVSDWQGLAWRLWSADSGELMRLVTKDRWPWWRRPKGLNQAGRVLEAVHALRLDGEGRVHLRPRHEAADAALKILQARRYDAESAIQMGMCTTWTTWPKA